MLEIILKGPQGSGKATRALEISEMLKKKNVPHIYLEPDEETIIFQPKLPIEVIIRTTY